MHRYPAMLNRAMIQGDMLMQRFSLDECNNPEVTTFKKVLELTELPQIDLF